LETYLADVPATQDVILLAATWVAWRKCKMKIAPSRILLDFRRLSLWRSNWIKDRVRWSIRPESQKRDEQFSVAATDFSLLSLKKFNLFLKFK
jgi:hypothetical protein